MRLESRDMKMDRKVLVRVPVMSVPKVPHLTVILVGCVFVRECETLFKVYLHQWKLVNTLGWFLTQIAPAVEAVSFGCVVGVDPDPLMPCAPLLFAFTVCVRFMMHPRLVMVRLTVPSNCRHRRPHVVHMHVSLIRCFDVVQVPPLCRHTVSFC